jgi:hypothetical protein
MDMLKYGDSVDSWKNKMEYFRQNQRFFVSSDKDGLLQQAVTAPIILAFQTGFFDTLHFATLVAWPRKYLWSFYANRLSRNFASRPEWHDEVLLRGVMQIEHNVRSLKEYEEFSGTSRIAISFSNLMFASHATISVCLLDEVRQQNYKHGVPTEASAFDSDKKATLLIGAELTDGCFPYLPLTEAQVRNYIPDEHRAAIQMVWNPV